MGLSSKASRTAALGTGCTATDAAALTASPSKASRNPRSTSKPWMHSKITLSGTPPLTIPALSRPPHKQ
eukprot:6521384-Alexandrium_andersonii.AAC.1